MSKPSFSIRNLNNLFSIITLCRHFPGVYNSDLLIIALYCSFRKQALARQIGEVIEFALKFDGIKMMKPAIQNDFSYYRRSMGKRELDELTVSSEDANTISLFLAASSPMINVLTKVLLRVVSAWRSIVSFPCISDHWHESFILTGKPKTEFRVECRRFFHRASHH